jgi:hypothetical protein
MKRRRLLVSFALAAGAAILLSLAMLGSGERPAQGQAPEGVPPIKLVFGDAAIVDGNLVTTWARVLRGEVVKEVGVTIPVDLFDHQPQEDGDGPFGAIASLAFPRLVREQTFFNHFELHSEPEGHVAPPGSVNPDRYRVPHFDFHFYAVSEDVVWQIPLVRPPSPALPAVPAERIPEGYIQPGFSQLQMGRHSSPASALLDPEPFSTVMVAGFPPAVEGLPDPTQMHFLEPMVSREFLLERNDFELPLPRPKSFGRLMFYPTKFVAEYDADLDAYHFVFSEFEVVE